MGESARVSSRAILKGRPTSADPEWVSELTFTDVKIKLFNSFSRFSIASFFCFCRHTYEHISSGLADTHVALNRAQIIPDTLLLPEQRPQLGDFVLVLLNKGLRIDNFLLFRAEDDALEALSE